MSERDREQPMIITDLHDAVRQSLQVILSRSETLYRYTDGEWRPEAYDAVATHVHKVNDLVGLITSGIHKLLYEKPSEVIQWNDPESCMPIAWLDVLVTEEHGDGKRCVTESYVFPMSFVGIEDDEEQWQWNRADSDGGRLRGRVVAWAHMPKGVTA